jgi:hypothetical protein
MNRAEHLQWCKRRALEYLPHDPQGAVASMISDLGKHPETANLTDLGMLGICELQSPDPVPGVRKFIEGFA